MKISYAPYELKLKYPFSISGYSRTSTPLLLLEIFHEGFTGYGEASMVPYMGERVETASAFLDKIDPSSLKYPFDYDQITSMLDGIEKGNPAIKAALDIALHDLQGKIEQKPCFELLGADKHAMPVTSVTIGIDTPGVIIQKVKDAAFASVLKIKLGSADDKALINTIRSVSDKPLYADANQGWKDRYQAIDMVHWLHEQGVEIIEQPMAKEDRDGNAWVTERSPVPILADEAVQRYADMEKIKGAYHGINVKLMKSAGMYEAGKMIRRARELDMKILIGCMSETSIATLAGAALAPLCDWADLDGPFLTANNPFKDPDFSEGKWVLSEEPGLGLGKR